MRQGEIFLARSVENSRLGPDARPLFGLLGQGVVISHNKPGIFLRELLFKTSEKQGNICLMELNSSLENNKHSSPWKEDEEAYEPREAAGSFNNSAYESSKSMKTFAKRIILGILLFTAGFGYYYFFARLPQPNVGLEFSKPDQTLLGQPFAVSVSFSNYSDQILKNAKLSVLLDRKSTRLNS